jgi:AraC-like DNA-binding protein
MQVTHLLSPTDILWKTLEEYGFNAEIIFLKEGITREMILKPGTRIPHAKAENLWSRVAGLIEDPCFGLHAAKFWHPSHFNALGYAWLASSTLREAFYRASRYALIVGCDRETRIEERSEEIIVTLSDSLKLPPLMDLSISIFISACRANYGTDLNPVGVKFIHPRPNCGNEYEAYFKAPVEFDGETDSIIFSKAVADKDLPIGNQHLAEINDQYIIRYLDNMNINELVNHVKSAIIDILPSGKITDEDVAYKLNLGVRTLQRKLHNNNTNFRSILDEVRYDLAKFYIHDSDISLMEIAFILGYSEYTSFSRAYKRWTGIPPGKDRHLGQLKLGVKF